MSEISEKDILYLTNKQINAIKIRLLKNTIVADTFRTNLFSFLVDMLAKPIASIITKQNIKKRPEVLQNLRCL